MKCVFLLTIFCSLIIKGQNDLPEEAYSYFEELKKESQKLTCECFSNIEEGIEIRKALDDCWKQTFDELAIKYQHLNDDEFLKKIAENPDLSRQMGILFNSIPQLVGEYLISNCLVIQEMISKEQSLFIELFCKEKIDEVFQGSIEEGPFCDCFKDLVFKELICNSKYWEIGGFWKNYKTEDILREIMNNRSLSKEFYYCLDHSIEELGKDDPIMVNMEYLSLMKESTKLNFQEEGLDGVYDVDIYCDCFYGKIIGKVSSRVWFEYISGTSNVIEKINEECLNISEK